MMKRKIAGISISAIILIMTIASVIPAHADEMTGTTNPLTETVGTATTKGKWTYYTGNKWDGTVNRGSYEYGAWYTLAGESITISWTKWKENSDGDGFHTGTVSIDPTGLAIEGTMKGQLKEDTIAGKWATTLNIHGSYDGYKSGGNWIVYFHPSGFNSYGYNYGARIFNGWYSNYVAGRTSAEPPLENDQMYYNEWYLVMKWSEGWDNARFMGGEWDYDAWTTNHYTYMTADGWTYESFTKIVWTDGVDPDGDGPAYVLWGSFAAIQDVYYATAPDGTITVFADWHTGPAGLGGPAVEKLCEEAEP
jgi:hypothetical protein